MNETPQDIPGAVRKAADDLARARLELADARELVKTLEADVVNYERELYGLKSFANRYGLVEATGSPQPDHFGGLGGSPGGADVVPISPAVSAARTPAQPGGRTGGLDHLNRNDAVAQVLASVGSPMNRAEIHEQCVYGGREDTLDGISLALTGLKRSGRVQKLGDGLWCLTETPGSLSEPAGSR